MNITINIVAIIICLFCLMQGCSRQDNPKSNKQSIEKSNEVRSFATLPEDAALVVVNGRKLTKFEFSNWVRLRQTIMAKSLPTGEKVSEAQLDFVRSQMLTSVTNDFPREVVLTEYAKEIGILASTNEVQHCRRGFKAVSHLNGRSWNKVLAAFPKHLQEVIENRVASEAVALAVRNKWLKENPVEMDKAEVDKLYAEYNDYNKACAATNLLTWALASNIWQRIKSGDDFIKLADKYDQDEYKNEAHEWGIFHVSDFTDEPDVWKLTRQFKKGYLSPPVEGDNGLMIMKITAVTDGEADTEAVDYLPSPDAEFTISRIFLRLPMFIEEVSEKRFANEVQVAKANALFNEFVQGLISKAKIEYPCGVRIFRTKGEPNK